MGAALQLQLLLWKNYILRKRHWGRLLVEIVWPLFLFIILFLVRLKGLKNYHHECYFEEKAMPSTGALTFAQSFVCTFNNTCHRSLWTEPNILERHDKEFYEGIITDVETALRQSFDTEEKTQALSTVINEVQGLIPVFTKLTSGNITAPDGFSLLTSVVSEPADLFRGIKSYFATRNISMTTSTIFLLAGTSTNFSTFFAEDSAAILKNPNGTLCNSSYVRNFVSGVSDADLDKLVNIFCSMTPEDVRQIGRIFMENMNTTLVMEQINLLLVDNGGVEISWEEWSAVFSVLNQTRIYLETSINLNILMSEFEGMAADVFQLLSKGLWNMSANISSSNYSTSTAGLSLLPLVSRVVCGRNLSLNTFSSGGQVTRFDQLRDQLQEKDSEEFKYKYDNTTTKECNAIMESLEKSAGIRFLWSQMKPFVRGKILYTPDNVASRKIISLVNLTFSPVEYWEELLDTYTQNYSIQIRDFLLDPERQEQIKDAVLLLLDDSTIDSVLAVTGQNLSLETTVGIVAVRARIVNYFQSNYSAIWEGGLDSIENLAQNVSQYLECFEINKFEPVNSESEMEKRGLKLIETNRLWAGLVFTNFATDQETIPRMVSYKIRLDADKVDSTKRIEDRLNRKGPRRRPGIDLKYLYYGFGYLQDMVEHAIIFLHTGRNISSLPGITLQQEPYPCYIEDRFVMAIARTFPLFMTLAWVYSASMIIKSIVHEKETRMKETMRVMGLNNWIHWVSWFIDSFCVMFVSCFLLTIILVFGNILGNSEPTLVFCFMLCYTISTIMLSFLISTFFSRANIAAAAGGIIFFILYLPYSFMVVWEESLQSLTKILSCLISNIAFGFGCAYFSHFEESGIGAQWDNVWTSPLQDDTFSLAGCMGMMLVDSVIYGILMWYIEAVFPGEFGVPKPFYFFLTLSYWTGRGNRVPQYDSESDLQLGGRSQDEDEPTNLPLGVSIKHLHKVYNSGKVAVEDLNLNFYEGQITSFLGHNGAGKTTTISILTGLFPPSAGTALIYNLDITKDMDRIRDSLGTCPQHNVLFNELTVEEHLWFFARLKNQPKESLPDQITSMIQDLGIPHKRAEKSENLSGGMQRKLSIACAFVGGSKVVVLDEPTAGVDPYSRRAIWDLLIKYKAGRTIILTTHFMDEADLLGDRIAIINCGKLVCVGSSLFLKNLYGVGYYLTMVKNTNKDGDEGEEDEGHDESLEDVEDEEELDDDEGISDISTHDTIINPSNSNSKFAVYPLTKFIQKFVPEASLVEQIGQEIVFVLPVNDNKEESMKQFEVLFNELDKNLKKLRITTYGLSDTTLEEIFLKVASNENDGQILRNGNNGENFTHNRVRSSIGVEVRKKGRHFWQSKQETVGMEPPKAGQKTVTVTLDGTRAAYTEVPLGEMGPPRAEATEDSMSGRGSAFGGPSQPRNTVASNTVQLVKSTGRSLVAKHIMALEIKRFHHSRRNKKGFVCEIILPALFVCLAMAFTQILPPLTEEPPLEINPWIYPRKGGPNYMFYSDDLPDQPSKNWNKRYIEELLSDNSVGTKCIAENKDKCDATVLKNKSLLSYDANITVDDSANPDCTCSVGTQICPSNAIGPEIPQMKIPTGDFLLNMTDRNISQWWIKTTDEYYKKRYGGFEFGARNPLANKNLTWAKEVFGRLSRATNLGKERINTFITNTVFNEVDRYLDVNRFDNIRVWFNNKGWAASVAYMNAVNNIVLRASLKAAEEDDFDAFFDFDGETSGKYDATQYGIQLTSHPMNYTEAQLDKELIRQIGISLLHAICIIFAMSFVPASFVVFLIEERVTKIKHLHFVSGVKPGTYWTAALIWDLIMYVGSALLCIIIFLIFDTKAYVSKDNLFPLCILMLLYGWSGVPLMYPASFFFSIPSSAFVTLACANLFIGIITTVTTFVLENFDDEELKRVGEICRVVFLVFPHYCLGRGLMDMATEESLNSVISKFGLESVRNRFEWDFLGKYMVCMFVQGIVFFTVTMLIQSKFWRWRSKQPTVDLDTEESAELDEDVKRERTRVLSSSPGDDVLQVRNLFKKYNKNSKQAVDELTFGVGKAECFGLLGVNGAGKTSTFKMMTGDTEVTAGEAFVNGYSILTQMAEVRQSLGYCPQFDALDNLLTGREHLSLYARLRGLDEAAVARVTEWGLKKLGLVAYSEACAGTYSGGNKRKLSTAIALIGNPSVVFLDEPTSGMDPGARRFLWNTILEMIKGGQSVVLTSHSMEECEALCSRLGIMVNGQFKCLGSAQHLKNRFGSGYTLTIRCQEGKTHETRLIVEELLPQGEIKEEHHTQVKYQLPSVGTKLPLVFRKMEDCRARGLLEDYSLTQTTLDEVFIRFASDQKDVDEVDGEANSVKRKLLKAFSKKSPNSSDL